MVRKKRNLNSMKKKRNIPGLHAAQQNILIGPVWMRKDAL